jgi:hypothetical protein
VPEENKIELMGDIWINREAKHKEITIKGTWRMSSNDEGQDFEYSYFKEFDKTLQLPNIENPVFSIEKDYSMLVRGGMRPPLFLKDDFTLTRIPEVVGGVYRGWFDYNGRLINEFSSLNFLPVVDEETAGNTFSIEGECASNALGDGHNEIGVYIIDGKATLHLEQVPGESGGMTKIGSIKLYRYYTKVRELDELPHKRSDADQSTRKVSIKISKEVFGIQKYSPEEAEALRKTLPQFI